MEKPPQHQAHILFDTSPLDHRDELDERTQRAHHGLEQLIQGKSHKECHEIYLKYISSPPNPQQNIDELTMGLLVAILIDQDGQQSRYYRDVVTFSKDNLNLFCTHLNMIIIERLPKLREHSIKQIFWIAQQLMKANINMSENICSNIIRQTAGGDLSPKNLCIVENLLDLLIENRAWLTNPNARHFMIPTTVYTFMRLIADHLNSAHSALRQREIDFVIGLIREKFLDCMQIGRDFLRLLYNIVKVPEFDKLWQDIFNKPQSLHPTFQSPLQLLTTRTPRRLVQSRLTIDMEKKITFLATQVKFGNQRRYQDWLHKQYLSTPESFSLRCDLIRYLCHIIHPSNEVLCSDIIPRWAIIGWLLTTCSSSVSAAQSRLTLFYDWLLYDPKLDNIMNIEPAILVMYYSMRSHPAVTASLLDYLCRLPTTFSPKLSEQIKAGIKKSLSQILEKRVVQSLVPLFDNPKHDATLRSLIRETFPEFCAGPMLASPPIDNGISSPQHQIQSAPMNPIQPTTNMVGSNQNLISPTPKQSMNDVQVIDLEKPTQASRAAAAAASVNHNETTAIVKSSPTIPSDESATEQSTGIIKPESQYNQLPNGLDASSTSPIFGQKSNHDIKARKNSMFSINSVNDKKSVGNNYSTPASIVEAILQPEAKKNLFGVTLIQSPNHSSESQSLEMIHTGGDTDDPHGKTKVVYSFMEVPSINFKEIISTAFDDPLRTILEDLSIQGSNEARCGLMDRLISIVFDNSEQSSSNPNFMKDLGHCMAYLLAGDFSERIFPSSPSYDNVALEASIDSPLFILCRSAFTGSRPNWTGMRPMSLLISILKHFEATGFLVLYFLRAYNLINGNLSVASCYSEFCTAAKRKLSKCLHEDLKMSLTYDTNMFCFLLPNVFGDLHVSGAFSITGNIDLIHLVVSAIDPINLQDLICLCLTGNAKVINKEEVLPLIESSLNWESWEQYCVWKLISAQSVPIENYISILPKLNSKTNAEAMTCILLNLQKVTDVSAAMLQQIINCDPNPNDPFISSILRYWTIKGDIKELAKMITSLFDSPPSSPQMKRKGAHVKVNKTPPTLSPVGEKILLHLESIRLRAPKNRLLTQAEIGDMLNQMESLCNEAQKKRFATLFSSRPSKAKKVKKMTKEVT